MAAQTDRIDSRVAEIEISAFRHPDIRACVEAQLVLRSVGIDSRIEPTDQGFAVYVREADFALAREQIALYIAENPPPPAPTRRSFGARPWQFAVAAVIAVLWGMALVAEQHIGGIDWYRAGRIDGAAVFAGEAWRLATALTLHADFGHLLANIASAILVVAIAARQLGGGVALLALAVSGTLGNAINLLVQGPQHLAVGASTAIFAGVGLAGVIETVRYGLAQRNWARQIGPLVLAVVVLTFFWYW